MEIPILQLSCHLLPLLFPTSCPYVRYCRWGTKHVPEVAIDFSGGGFSKYFSRPAYQDTAVAAFFETFPNGIFALGSFNPSVKWPIICNGRYVDTNTSDCSAIPDVAAQADNFQVVIGGETGLIGETSAT
ncbi:hypothetical protein F5880DRAFT_1504405 [Lentinula raphanica]|nr:hypothetical protein F5880DRAFT_1504405 [Lentinula raphanica]